MSWTEQETQSREKKSVTAERQQELDQAREQTLPTLKKEAESGAAPFKPLEFQPVRSPGLFEAEFAVKDEDLIFHFWPYGYRMAERSGQALPAFKRGFKDTLAKAMSEVFEEKRLMLSDDRDVGALAVCAQGYGLNQFNRDLSIKVCEKLHSMLGGA